MQTYVPPRCAFTPACSEASARCAERCVQVGLSKPTWATIPPTEKRGDAQARAIEELIRN